MPRPDQLLAVSDLLLRRLSVNKTGDRNNHTESDISQSFQLPSLQTVGFDCAHSLKPSHLLDVFRITLSHHLNLRRGIVDLTQVVRRQRKRHSAKILIEAMKLR